VTPDVNEDSGTQPHVPTDLHHAHTLTQVGDRHDATKVLKGFGGAGVLEVVEDDAGDTYRAVYTVKFPEAVFVLHCFQKKSKRGIATPKEDMARRPWRARSGLS
jgi:phage-related protein